MRTVRRFTEQEDDFIKENFGRITPTAIARHLGRDPASVVSREVTLGIRIPNRTVRKFSKTEDQIIKRNAGRISMAQIAARLGRVPSSCYGRAATLGLRFSPTKRSRNPQRRHGYMCVPIVDGGRRLWRLQHRVRMERHIGRPLRPEERIHHINFTKTDNRKANLYLCETDAQHRAIHNRLCHLLGSEAIVRRLLASRVIGFNRDLGELLSMRDEQVATCLRKIPCVVIGGIISRKHPFSLVSLSSVLERGPVGRQYYLSPKACAGILRRAEKRGKELPPALKRALQEVALRGQTLPPGGGLPPVAKALKTCTGGIDRENGHTLIPEVSGTLTAGKGMLGASDNVDCDKNGALTPEIAPTLRAGANATGGDRPPGTDVDTCESLIPEVSGTLNSNHGNIRAEAAWGGSLVPEVADTLRSGSTNPASHGKVNGTDRMTLVPEVADCLQERDSKGSDSKGSDSSTKNGHLIPVEIAIPFDTTQLTSKGNYSSPQAGDPCHPLASAAHPPAVVIHLNGTDIQDGKGVANAMGSEQNGQGETLVAFSCKDSGGDATDDLTPTLRTMGHDDSHANGGGQVAIHSGMMVRRLLPVECCRLQGFPDSHLDITFRGKPACDGPKYRGLGNSFAVPCILWIGKRIEEAAKGGPT